MLEDDLEYWFMRWLIDSDEFSGYGSDYPEKLIELSDWIRENSEHETLEYSLSYIREELLNALYRSGTKKERKTEAMIERTLMLRTLLVK